MLQQGGQAPDFRLEDQNGTAHTLSDYKGTWVVLYFYPKDDTPGCTAEACAFRDEFAAFQKNGIVVLGVSIDSAQRHAKFIAKYNLPFTLLADTEKAVVAQYGVWGKKKFMGREYMGTNRVSFLIDPDGKIIKVYPKVKPADHARQVLEDYDMVSRVQKTAGKKE